MSAKNMEHDLAAVAKGAMESVQEKNSCPPATRDISVNIKNRQVCIDKARYGPMNPELPNNKFWQAKADMFNTDLVQAKSARCGNCAAFVQTPQMIKCIEKGLGDEPGNVAPKIVDKANLGFCEIFDFKCAGDRTCDAWVTGGPIKS